jgi:hypothetical protein
MHRYPELMKLILLFAKNSKKPLRSTDICIPRYSIAEITDPVHLLIRSEHLKGIYLSFKNKYMVIGNEIIKVPINAT